MNFILLVFNQFSSNTVPAYFAQSEFNVRKLLLKRLIHVFLQIRWFDVFYNCCLEERRGTAEEKTEQKKRSVQARHLKVRP